MQHLLGLRVAVGAVWLQAAQWRSITLLEQTLFHVLTGDVLLHIQNDIFVDVKGFGDFGSHLARDTAYHGGGW